MEREKLVERLSGFLTPNQAKVYSYLCEVHVATISDISKITGIHVQDVYKVVASLGERASLKNETQPLTIEAIPVEKALPKLMKSIESNTSKKIERLKINCEEILAERRKNVKPDTQNKQKNNPIIVFFDKEAPESRVDLAFDSLDKEYDSLMIEGSPNYRKLGVDYGEEQFKKLAKRGVKIRFLSLSKDKRFEEAEALKKWVKGNYQIKTLTLKDIPFSPMALIDFNELWIVASSSTGEEGATFLTNLREVVELAKFQFEALWNNPNTKSIAQNDLNGRTNRSSSNK